MSDTGAGPIGRSQAVTQGELAFVQVRDRIMTGAYPPGTRLSEHAVAQELALSRTPVREALRRLSETGLVELSPNQRAKVMGWNVELLRDTLDTRVLLESEGARHAATRIGVLQLEELVRLMLSMEEVAKRGSSDEGDKVASLNQEFHATIMRASDQHQIIRLTGNLRFQPRMTGVGKHGAEFRARANHQHREIYLALEAHDSEWAEAAMRSHLLAGRHASLCAYEPHETGIDSEDWGR